jgi:hypothetical protein
MALGFAIVQTLTHERGNRRGVVDLTLDASYDTGGWPLDAADITSVGLRSLVKFDVPAVDVSGTYLFHWDAVNAKLKAFTALGVEAAADLAGLDGIVLRCSYLGS